MPAIPRKPKKGSMLPSPRDEGQRIDPKSSIPWGQFKSLNAAQQRVILRRRGYDLDKGGERTARMLSAIKHFKSTGGVTAKTWNKKHPEPVQSAPPGLQGPVGGNQVTVPSAVRNDRPRPSRGGGGGGGGPSPADDPSPQIDLAATRAALTGGIGRMSPIPDVWATSRGGELLDEGFAENIAGLQYDSAISGTGLEQKRIPLQNAQNEQDIQSWFGQALRAFATAATRNKATGQAASQSVTDAAAKIAASLGGGDAGALAGAAGVDDAAAMAGLNTAQSQYDENIQPLLAAEQAANLSRERAAGTTRTQDIAAKLADLHRERGQAKSSALFDIKNANNTLKDRQLERLMQIRGANNSLAQQKFQNKLALSETEIAALMAGLKVTETMQPEPTKPPKGSWADTTASVKGGVHDSILGSIIHPSGKLRLGQQHGKTVKRVAGMIQGRGWSFKNPRVRQFANDLLREAGVPQSHWFIAR